MTLTAPEKGPPPEPRPVGDMFAPVFKVRLTSLQGTDVTAIDFSEGISAGRPGLASVTVRDSGGIGGERGVDDLVLKINASLTAESKAGSPFRFVLTMTPEYEDGLILLNTQSIGYATMVEVQWGYVSATGATTLTRKHTFRNIQPKAKFGENIQIIIDGWDTLTDTSARRTLNLADYKSTEEFVKKLADRVGYTVDSSSLTDPEHPFFKKRKFKRHQNLTDFQLLKQLLREVQVTFVIRGAESAGPTDAVKTSSAGTIEIYDPKVVRLKTSTDYTFKFRQKLTEAYDIPITSIDANFLQYFFQPPAGNGLKLLCFDPETGETEARDLDASDTEGEVPTTGKGEKPLRNIASDKNTKELAPTDKDSGKQTTAVPAKSTESEETGVKLSCPPNGDIKVDPGIGINIVKEAEIMGSPMLKIKSPGVPDMFPGLLVEVAGATKAFDGIYNVLTTKHSISNSGYDMDVELIRWTTKRPTSSKAPDKIVDTNSGKDKPVKSLPHITS